MSPGTPEAAARALPGADEHLRGSRQHAVPPRRTEWRGIRFHYAAAGPGDGFSPADHDLIYIGGGQDRDQVLVAEDMFARSATRSPRPSRTAPPCWRSAAATSCSAIDTSWARSPFPAWGSSTSRRSGNRDRG